MTTQKHTIWMPFYATDYLRDTTHLTTEQHGAYLLLLLSYWVNGPLDDDNESFAAITRLPPSNWKRMRPKIEAFFTIEGGRWHQRRADKERMKALAITQLRSAAGKEGASKRYGKPMANAMAEPVANGQQSHQQTHTPSQSQRITTTESGSAREAACVANAPRPRHASSGDKKLSDTTSAILKATLEAVAAK